MEDKTPTDADLATSIRKRIEELKCYRTSSFRAVEKKPGGKVVHLVAIWKSTLAYRLVDIAEASLNLSESNRIVPGNILARSALETVGAAHALSKKTSEKMTAKQLGEFSEFLMQSAFGSRDQSSDYTAKSVLTIVSHLDKIYGIQDQYDHLSEYTHPNLKGSLMAYSDISSENFHAQMGINPSGLPLFSFGLGDLDLILFIGTEVFKAMETSTKAFNEMILQLAPEIFLD